MFPSWQQTLADLHSAETAEELWAVLLTPHGIRSTSAWDEPYMLLRRHHPQPGPETAFTALLLCTDHRWRKAARLLIRRLAESDRLDADDLDDLAEAFAESRVTVGEIDGQPIVRRVWPPLRRWSATRRVNAEPWLWRTLLEQAAQEPTDDGSALAAGVMDAADALPADDRLQAVEVGLAWSTGPVRIAALAPFARLAGDDAAIERALGDSSAKVRSWRPTSAGGQESEPQERSSGSDAAQPSLFD